MSAEPTPFAQVDDMPPQIRALILGALERMAASPEIQRVRRVAQAALDPRPGQRLLDVGSGVGEVARQLAAAVAPDGEVVAVDASAAAVAVATDRHDGSAVTYAVGDITALDFPDASFDGVRTERVLQHLADPDAAVAELARVTRPGGRVCLVDTDWTSVAGDGLPDDLVDAIWRAVPARQHHPTMGRTLRGRLVRAGLAEVRCEPVPLWFTDPESASAVIPVFNKEIPREAGIIPDELRDRWFAAVDAAAARDEFLAVLTIWVAVGVTPARTRPA
ncbi:methyltransferase domain-containing protein [Phytohabitans rumicis]|uniref:Methyltransferase type 11 domain-containing protein n=1 Tax=Phytohabitans rumicis TaxID=1076125 RepID=A0A6V8L164_9ACTN|nr:methyltransferase domain-containing protein [Phytohabitans rumicis]GFJ88359.1 hypothetical protein Prum_020010 [Phytohabitans rumicis]